MKIEKILLFTLLLLSFSSFAQRGAGEQLKEALKEQKKVESETASADRNKRNVATVSPSQKELDDFLFDYLNQIDSSNSKEHADSILTIIEKNARTAAMNSYFSKCSFNALRAVAVINRCADEGEYSKIEKLSQNLTSPLSLNYDGKIVPIWFYSVYKASLGMDNKLARMKYLNTMAFMAKDSIKTNIFSEYFIGKMIKRMLVKEKTLFKDIYSEYKLAKNQAVMTNSLCSILSKNGMYRDLAYALWVFQPLLGEKVDTYSDNAIKQIAMTNNPEKDELATLFKELNK